MARMLGNFVRTRQQICGGPNGGKVQIYNLKDKGKAVPLKAWSGPESSRKLRFPNFMATAQDGGNVVSLRHRPPLPQEIHLVLISIGAWGSVVVKALRY
jgi:hypothetical protein